MVEEVRKVDVDFVKQLVDSMDAAVEKLEQVVSSGKSKEIFSVKAFIFDLQDKLDKELKNA